MTLRAAQQIELGKHGIDRGFQSIQPRVTLTIATLLERLTGAEVVGDGVLHAQRKAGVKVTSVANFLDLSGEDHFGVALVD